MIYSFKKIFNIPHPSFSLIVCFRFPLSLIRIRLYIYMFCAKGIFHACVYGLIVLNINKSTRKKFSKILWVFDEEFFFKEDKLVTGHCCKNNWRYYCWFFLCWNFKPAYLFRDLDLIGECRRQGRRSITKYVIWWHFVNFKRK